MRLDDQLDRSRRRLCPAAGTGGRCRSRAPACRGRSRRPRRRSAAPPRRRSATSQRATSSSATRSRSSTCALSVSAQARPVPPASSARRASSRPFSSAPCRLATAARRNAASSSACSCAKLGKGVDQPRAVEPLAAWMAGLLGRGERGRRSTAGPAMDMAAIFSFGSAPASGDRVMGSFLSRAGTRSRPRSRLRDRGRPAA